MNKKLVIGAVLISVLFGLYIYTNYKNEEKIDPEKIYLLQIGAYKNSDNVTKVTKMVNYNYVEYNNGIYYIYVGITNNKDVLDKLLKLYENKGNNIYIKEKKTTNKEFIEYLKAHDKIINSITEDKLIEEIEKEILKKYEKTI